MRILRRFARDREGAVALEMAFVGPPFLLVLLALLDFGQTMLTQSVLDGATRDAARLIRTGQVQTSGSPLATFQNLLCSEMSALMSTATCQSSVLIEVQVFSAYGTMTFASCKQNQTAQNQGQSGTCGFAPGAAGNIVGVTVSYARPYIVPWVGACLTGGSCWTGSGTGSAQGTQTTTLSSTVIFQNEPFGAS
jgi:Flp pilus assembly protein TadG